MEVKINIDGVELVEDEKYYRINLNLGTHHFHSEKLNKATASDLLFKLTSRNNQRGMTNA